ncbi:MAG: tRNA (adenosine(37)-N6)-threonylcarbamoyltransferase complex transferase subunit TsaD [bacterium]
MLILGLETSCDDTACAIVEDNKILANIISSQTDLHKKYGGIIPELASRKHLETINILIEEAFKKAKVGFNDINLIAVTYGPGLKGSLLIGLSCAKAISYAKGIPLVGVSHLEGHLYANFLEHKNISMPLTALIISGGHSDLILMKKHGDYEVLGRTRDDAVGEAYDKVAKLLELGYPGGPIIDKLAKEGNPKAVHFTRPYLKGSWDFSFSGIKTAVVNHVAKAPHLTRQAKADIVASFQQAVIEVLVHKTIEAAKKFRVKTIILGGGVASNSALRTLFEQRAKDEKLKLYYPVPVLCTDNAAMIAGAAYYKVKNKKAKKLLTPADFRKLQAEPDLGIV